VRTSAVAILIDLIADIRAVRRRPDKCTAQAVHAGRVGVTVV
jgi:hypothetical protein